MTTQEKFDTAMAIIIGLVLATLALAWYIALHEPSGKCHVESRYKNTLQYDIHRQRVCEDK